MARSLRRIARMDAPLGPASVTARKRRSPAARRSGQPKASASGQGEACASGQNYHPRRDAKNANADRLVTLHAKFISSHGWLAQGKLMAPTFSVAVDRCRE